MKKVGVIMAKGGAGKSTLVRHLAVAAHQEDFATVVLDTDPQGTLQDWAERRNGQEPHVVTEYSTNPDRIAKAFERIEAAGADLLVVDTQGQHVKRRWNGTPDRRAIGTPSQAGCGAAGLIRRPAFAA